MISDIQNFDSIKDEVLATEVKMSKNIKSNSIELNDEVSIGVNISLNRPLIEKVFIHHFKSIEKANVPLSHLNILIGGNGAGKSNFISFFKLVQAITEGRLQDFVNYDISSLLRFGRKSTSIFGGLVFGNTQTNHKNAIGFYVKPREKNENAYIPLLSDRYNRGRGDATDSEAINTWDEKIIDQNVDEATLMERKNDYRVNYVFKYLTGFRVYHFHDTSSDALLRSPCDKENNRLLAENGSNLPAYLYYLQVHRPKIFKKIEGVVRLIAPFFDRFDLEPNRSNDKIELRWREKGAGIDDYFNAHYLSDGMLRFIALATLLLQPEEDLPKTIIIDEPELGLHPSAIGHLAEMLKAASQKCQVIVATQSIDLVNYFEAEDIIAVDRINRTEGTTFKRFKKSELAEWLNEYGMGELWEKNVIGGNP